MCVCSPLQPSEEALAEEHVTWETTEATIVQLRAEALERDGQLAAVRADLDKAGDMLEKFMSSCSGEA